MKALFLFVLSMCGIARTQTVSTWGEQMACANTAQREGRYAKSEQCLRAALETANSIEDRTFYATTLSKLGGQMVLSGRPRDAEQFYMQSLSIYEAVAGPSSLDAAVLLHNIAVMYRVLANYSAAETHCRRALAIQEADTTGKSESAIATTLNTLGAIHFAAGRYAEAERTLLCSLNLGDTTNLAHTLNNLGTAYRQLGQFGEAEKAYERALHLISHLHGRDQPGSHFIVINLTLLRMHLGKWKLALEDATLTAAMLRRRLGEDDLDYAAAISAQSLIRFNMGDYYQAERLARRVSAIRERKLGRDHPENPKTLNNLGGIVLAQNRPAEAEKLFTQGYRVLSASPSDQHIDTIYTVNNLATVRLVQRRSPGVAELLENAVVNINHTQKSHHPYALRVKENLASAYLQSGRFREAEVQIKATLARLEGAIGSDNPQLVRTLNNVGEILRRSNRLDEAESYFHRALAVAGASSAANHPHLPITLVNYALLRKAKGLKKESRQMEALARQMAERQAKDNFLGLKTHVVDLKR